MSDMGHHQGIVGGDVALHCVLRELISSHMVGGSHTGIPDPASSGFGDRPRELLMLEDAPWGMPQERCMRQVVCQGCPDEPPRFFGATGVTWVSVPPLSGDGHV